MLIFLILFLALLYVHTSSNTNFSNQWLSFLEDHQWSIFITCFMLLYKPQKSASLFVKQVGAKLRVTCITKMIGNTQEAFGPIKYGENFNAKDIFISGQVRALIQ